VSGGLEALIDSLLYEGYALYPYTPGATKNATPTPFGIVYPPGYAALSGSTLDHLQMECMLLAEPAAVIHAELRFLQPSGARHQAESRRITTRPATLSELSEAERSESFRGGGVAGRVVLSATPSEDGWRVRLSAQNLTRVANAEEMSRRQALDLSLISTLPLLTTSGGRFVSPLGARACANVNTWPVLVGDNDRTVLGAAVVLPDHPVVAPQSRANLFDGTEIEEALLLHIQALSNEERESIAQQDPAVRDMIARALSLGAGDLTDLHGEFTPATDPQTVAQGVPGESEMEVDGTTFRRGAKVVLRPGDRPRTEDRTDAFDALLYGRSATIERIYLDPDDRVYLGVTVDDDPGRDLMRDTGRYLFFFTDEVEAAS
jgi:hypothetical protein